MPEKPTHGTDSFIDFGYRPGQEFCAKFLNSREFAAVTLKGLVRGANSLKKESLATTLAEAICSPDDQTEATKRVLSSFVTQPRQWLSFKIRTGNKPLYTSQQTNGSVATLLTEFGQAGWYGPISFDDPEKKYYVRTVRLPFRFPSATIDNIAGWHRWHVIGEVTDRYLALSWKGFTWTGEKALPVPGQFEYYKYIPLMFDELEKIVGGDWRDIQLDKLVLEHLWDAFAESNEYNWRDRRIRSDTDDVVFSAHCAESDEDEEEAEDTTVNQPKDVASAKMAGLRAMSNRLASEAVAGLRRVSPQFNALLNPAIFRAVELSIRRALINSPGTKSYEFSLSKPVSRGQKPQKLFRAHCYFGNGGTGHKYNAASRAVFLRAGFIQDATIDGLVHLKCYVDYGNSAGTLSFLLQQLTERGL